MHWDLKVTAGLMNLLNLSSIKLCKVIRGRINKVEVSHLQLTGADTSIRYSAAKMPDATGVPVPINAHFSPYDCLKNAGYCCC